MNNLRSGGMLLHISSLPSSVGIGALGKTAFDFVDWLDSAKMRVWQVLPIGPTGYGDSPYASFSSFAGNPLFVDLDALVADGFASKREIAPPAAVAKTGKIDYGPLISWKIPLLNAIGARFAADGADDGFKKFKRDNAFWLNDYAVFITAKNFYDEIAAKERRPSIWFDFWQKNLARHEKQAVSAWRKAHAAEIETQKAVQYFFDRQWRKLKEYANSRDIQIMGDLPIFVAADSADAWANQGELLFGEDGMPAFVAGVPPDYFSADGQLWGNPLYDWEKMRKNHFSWWISRLRSAFDRFDILRLDHFRGFESFWKVGARESTARNGVWQKAEGDAFFAQVRRSIPDAKIVAEDLGVITEEVAALREKFGFPGMKVLQFAFSPDEIRQNGWVNPFMPHSFESANCVAYTGTHDNETLRGWLDSIGGEQKSLLARYFEAKNNSADIAEKMIRALFASVARLAVVPAQDIFALGDEARMNAPATFGENWRWRAEKKHFSAKTAQRLAEMMTVFGR